MMTNHSFQVKKEATPYSWTIVKVFTLLGSLLLLLIIAVEYRSQVSPEDDRVFQLELFAVLLMMLGIVVVEYYLFKDYRKKKVFELKDNKISHRTGSDNPIIIQISKNVTMDIKINPLWPDTEDEPLVGIHFKEDDKDIKCSVGRGWEKEYLYEMWKGLVPLVVNESVSLGPTLSKYSRILTSGVTG